MFPDNIWVFRSDVNWPYLTSETIERTFLLSETQVYQADAKETEMIEELDDKRLGELFEHASDPDLLYEESDDDDDNGPIHEHHHHK